LDLARVYDRRHAEDLVARGDMAWLASVREEPGPQPGFSTNDHRLEAGSGISR